MNVAYVRTTVVPSLDGPFGPKAEGHPSVNYRCPACMVGFAVGDWTCLVALGPGGDVEAREKASQGAVYNAVAVEVHWVCATGRKAHTE